jgi:hypothetical protein
MNIVGLAEMELAAPLMGGVVTASELLSAFARECPNGVSFNSMTLRLLRQKVPFEDWQIEDLKAAMFQLGSGLWFSREMILDHESHLAFETQAMEWIVEYGCFSIERLFENFRDVLRHIANPEDCAAFLRHLNYMVAVGGREAIYVPCPRLIWMIL